jgi:RHS repeat-associated protein
VASTSLLRAISRSSTPSSGSAFASVSQTWDAAGRRATLDEAGAAPTAPLFSYTYQADGQLTKVAAATSATTHAVNFAYADTGLLTSRTNPWRTLNVTTRDAVGRIRSQSTTVASSVVMAETTSFFANGTLDTYGLTRVGATAWDETRAYTYNSRGQVTSEGVTPAAQLPLALNFQFDQGATAGLGIRTAAKLGTGAPQSWQLTSSGINSLARVTLDQSTAANRTITAAGVSLGADRVNLTLDGTSIGTAKHPGWADPVGAWTQNLSLQPGSHTLKADAVHPSGQYTATATSTFTVGGTGQAAEAITTAYDADGNVATRTYADGRLQTLTWDAFNRLIKLAQRDALGTGYDWTAVYDGLGRRLKTTQQTVTASVPTGAATVTTSIFDPQVEFLEIGVAINGVKAWKVYGPDLNGRFGGLNGTGGLEATILDAGGTTKGVINDQFGNGVGSVTSGSTVSWFTTRSGGYGPLPGVTAEVLTDITKLAESTAWRSRRIDPTGLYNLGARYYEPTSGRFLSPDPMGHAASMSLYDFCNGDPVNYFDADGRLAKKVAKFVRDFEIPLPGIGGSSAQEEGNAAVSDAYYRTMYPFDLANAAENTALDVSKYGRVKPVKGTRPEVWERSKAPDGKVYDPSGREIKPGEPWELGHKPGNKFSDAQKRAAEQGWDAETWKKYQRDPDIYRPERPRTNSGHQYESDW